MVPNIYRRVVMDEQARLGKHHSRCHNLSLPELIRGHGNSSFNINRDFSAGETEAVPTKPGAEPLMVFYSFVSFV